jgi:hypothetical protein
MATEGGGYSTMSSSGSHSSIPILERVKTLVYCTTERMCPPTVPLIIAAFPRPEGMMVREGSLWQLVSRFTPCSIASFGLGGSQAATWTGLLLRRETDGRCMGVCEARKSGQMTCWKLQFPRMKTQTERRLCHLQSLLLCYWDAATGTARRTLKRECDGADAVCMAL